MLVEQERIAEKGKSRHPDRCWRKDVRFLSDKVLRPVVLAHRETRNIRSDWRKRICRRTTAVHVAEIQRIRPGKVMIQPHSELIVIRAQGLRGDESICSLIWQREKWQ